MRIHSFDLHTEGRIFMNVRRGGSSHWMEIKDKENGPYVALFSDLPEHVLIDACKAFNKVISEAMEGVDENGSL